MNQIIAWLSAILVLASVAIWPLRVICSNPQNGGGAALRGLRKALLKIHIPLGILSTVAVVIHCQMEKQETTEKSPLGAFLLICLLALDATGLMRKVFPRCWLKIHKVVSVILFVGTIVHSVVSVLD